MTVARETPHRASFDFMSSALADSPLVSLCLPCYNGEQYLDAAIESVLHQELADFELVIVDDASSDASFEIAEAAAERDPRIRVHRNSRNQGIIQNWNRCVQSARGEWIKFIFQDDLLHPACVRLLIEAAGATAGLLIFSDRDIRMEAGVSSPIRDWFARELQRFSDVFPDRRVVSPDDFGCAVLDKLGANFLGEPTCALIHRTCFFQYGMFNPQLTQLGDLEFWSRVGCQEGVVYVPEKLATFRVHPGSSTVMAAGDPEKRFDRSHVNRILLYAAFLLDPSFLPLRSARPNAACQIRDRLLEAIQDAEHAIQHGGNEATIAQLRVQWQNVLARNPGIGLLRENREWNTEAQRRIAEAVAPLEDALDEQRNLTERLGADLIRSQEDALEKQRYATERLSGDLIRLQQASADYEGRQRNVEDSLAHADKLINMLWVSRPWQLYLKFKRVIRWLSPRTHDKLARAVPQPHHTEADPQKKG